MNFRAKYQSINKINETRQLLVKTENYSHFATQLLELLNQRYNFSDLIKNILFLIKAVTGFEAVGLRFKEGEDFPYDETIGFSRDFVKAERYLCARDHTGELIRGPEGNVYLECMCGNIISERTDPSLPFFTEGGSFWTNSTTELLASTAKEDRQGRTRNRCNSEGYESVALIPLQHDKENIGLLQLNDSRKDMFTSKLICFFEGVCPSIANALNSRQRKDNIPQTRKLFFTNDDTRTTEQKKI